MSTSYGFKPVSLAQQDTHFTVPNTGISCVIVQNESPLTLICSIDGTGSTKTINALTVDRIDIPTFGFSGKLLFKPQQVLDNINNAPSYALGLDSYGINEQVNGVYPVALPRAVTIGGSVPVSTSVNSIQNDNSSPKTNVVEATVQGDNQSSVILTNDGQLTLGNANRAATVTVNGSESVSGSLTANSINTGSVTASGTISGNALAVIDVNATNLRSSTTTTDQLNANVATVSGNLSSGSLSTGAITSTSSITTSGTISSNSMSTSDLQVNGNASVSGNVAAGSITSGPITTSEVALPSGSAVAATITPDSAGNINLNVSGNKIAQVNSGGIDATGKGITANVLHIVGSNAMVQLLVGSISRISIFSGNGPAQSVQHGLGATPDIVLIVPHTSGTATVGYDGENSSTVNVHLGANVGWKALAIKLKG